MDWYVKVIIAIIYGLCLIVMADAFLNFLT
jgi:hypothetical protein